MKGKGISAFIATILLVAFAVAIGGLVSLWLTGTITLTTGGVEVSNTTLCAGVQIDVDEVTATQFFYNNPSKQTISSMTAMTSDGSSVTLTTASLTSNQRAYMNWTRGTNTSVKLRGLCRASISVEGECESGLSCWK